MNIRSINYPKTIKANSLVSDTAKTDRFIALATVIFPSALFLFFLKISFPEILRNDPNSMDYFLAVLLPVLTIALGLYMIKRVLSRNRLKEINYSINFEKSKNLICETAKNINWELIEKNENVLIFKTNWDPFLEKQNITIVITPDKTFLFNSSPGLYYRFGYRRARFDDNFINFQANFKRLEKLTAVNNP